MQTTNNAIAMRRTTLCALSAMFALLAFLPSATPYAQPAQPAPFTFSALSDAYVLPGIYISQNIRDGYYKFDDADKYLHVGNTTPYIIGLSLGKRVSIDNPRLRFQAAFELGRGSVKDGDYEIGLTDGASTWSEWVSLYSIYWTGGLLAEAHWLFPRHNRTIFVSAGLGAHLTYFDIALKVKATGEDVEGGSNGMRAALSPSVNLGCGTEYRLRGTGAACVLYGLRFWQSANYKEYSAKFPMGVNYTEFFFSQSIQLQYLLPRRSRD